jgi:hypothetical protein
MTSYLESSAALRWLFNEEHGEAVLATLQEARKVVCSRLTLIQCRRVIHRAALEHRIDEAAAADLTAVLAQAAARWAVLEISREVADREEARFPVEPVRTLDAIHLASALALRELLPDLNVLSTDDRVRKNAVQLGFGILPA